MRKSTKVTKKKVEEVPTISHPGKMFITLSVSFGASMKLQKYDNGSSFVSGRVKVRYPVVDSEAGEKVFRILTEQKIEEIEKQLAEKLRDKTVENFDGIIEKRVREVTDRYNRDKNYAKKLIKELTDIITKGGDAKTVAYMEAMKAELEASYRRGDDVE